MQELGDVQPLVLAMLGSMATPANRQQSPMLDETPQAPRSQPDVLDPFLGGHLGLLSRWSPYKMPCFGGPVMAPSPHVLAQGANTLKVPVRSDCPSLAGPQP